MLTDSSGGQPITCTSVIWSWSLSVFAVKLFKSGWKFGTWVGRLASRGLDNLCVWVATLGDISSDCDLSCYPPVSPPDRRFQEQDLYENVWMFRCTRCESAVPQIMPCLCHRVIASCCLCCCFQHTHSRTRLPCLQPFLPRAFISNSFPSISAINHSSLSSNAAVAPKDGERGSDVYTRRHGLRQAKREGAFLIKITISGNF